MSPFNPSLNTMETTDNIYKLRVGMFGSLITVVLVISIVAGYFCSHVKPDADTDSQSLNGNSAKSSFILRRRAELNTSHARAVFNKRVEYQGVLDISNPLRERISNYKQTWGERLYALPKDMARYYQNKIFDEERQLTDKIRMFLRITPTEQQAIEQAAWRAWVSVTREEAKHTLVTDSGKKHVSLTVGAFEEEGKVIKEQLSDEIITILGQERAKLLLASKKWNRDFLSFGTRATDYKFFWSKRSKTWEMFVDKSWSSGTDVALAGRFYRFLPEELQERIPPEAAKIPELSKIEVAK